MNRRHVIRWLIAAIAAGGLTAGLLATGGGHATAMHYHGRSHVAAMHFHGAQGG